MMKKITGKGITPISDTEYNNLLHMIAVEHGLQLPQTPEEVQCFEEQFADEIQAASRRRPNLESVLALAKELQASDAPLTRPAGKEEPEPAYAMAARDGKGITPETEALMEKAHQQAKEKWQNEQ
ncbi:MAG: hypothetical protein GYB26_10105 [Gammaproteobacteria bacterium]|nr:hypothetical protein [Gammaproteobacteria bacterium]